jgi:hypothetical protein
MYKTLLILALGLGGCSTQESQPEPKKETVRFNVGQRSDGDTLKKARFGQQNWKTIKIPSNELPVADSLPGRPK